MTAAINDGEEATPPQRVTLDTLVACIILAARLNHRLDLDQPSARRLIRHVMDALESDPDNTLDPRRAFACRTDDGRLEEIAFFSEYRLDRDTWELTRVEQSLWGDPPVWVHAGSLEVSWYKFELAVTQALREARLLPVADAVPPSELEAQLTTSEQARAKAEADAETLRRELLVAQIARAEAEADAVELRRQAAETTSTRDGPAAPPQELPPGPDTTPASEAAIVPSRSQPATAQEHQKPRKAKVGPISDDAHDHRFWPEAAKVYRRIAGLPASGRRKAGLATRADVREHLRRRAGELLISVSASTIYRWTEVHTPPNMPES